MEGENAKRSEIRENLHLRKINLTSCSENRNPASLTTRKDNYSGVCMPAC